MKNLLLRNLIIVFLLAGCSGDSSIASYYSFPDGVWMKFDNPLIETNISKTGVFYIMYLDLEYDPSLVTEDLPVTVIMTTPSGEIRSRSVTLKPDPAKDKIRLTLRKDFAFSEKGSCIFEIENRSRYVYTEGMKRIGVIIEAEK